MPNLNPALLGLYAHGVAGDGGVVAVSGQTIAGPNAGGHPDLHGPDWFTSTEVLCKTYPPERLVAVDWQSGAQHVLYEGAVSDFCGGGGRWAALGYDGIVRVGTAARVTSEHRNEIAPIAFGADGAFACKKWHRDGLFLDGLELVPPDIRVEDVQVFDTSRCLYRVGRTVHGYGLQGLIGLALPFDFGWTRGIPIGARVLLACQRYGMGVIAFWADDPGRGWKLGPDPCYRLDIGLLGGGRVRAIWSRVSRDHVEDLYKVPGAVEAGVDWALSDPMVVFDEIPIPPDPPDPPDPEPPDPPDPEPPVSIPDFFHIVRAIHDANPQLLQRNDHDSVKEFYWRAAWALQQADGKFGFLTKSPGEAGQVINGVRVAEDAVAYGEADECVDIIANVLGNGPAHPAWQVVGRRSTNLRADVPPFETPGTPPPPPPPPPVGGVVVPRQDEFAAVVAELHALEARVNALEQRPGSEPARIDGVRVAIETENGHIFCAEGGGGDEVNATRRDAGAWETFTLRVRP